MAMRNDSIVIVISVLLFCLYFFVLAVMENSIIGYVITATCAIALAGIIIFAVLAARDIKQALSKTVDRYSLVMLAAIIIFFLIFSTLFMKKTELVFFDENIYQSIALNIANHGNALTCVYGSAQLSNCYFNVLEFDPNGWPFIIAVAYKLFGASQSTSYGLETLIGALSILSVFLLSSIITERKWLNVVSAFIFALMPQLYIWSNTPANPDLPFMMLAALSTFFFVLYLKRSGKATLALAALSLALTVYITAEAMLLIPIFIIAFFTLGKNGIRDTFRSRIKAIASKPGISRSSLYTIVISAFLILPEIYALVVTAHGRESVAVPFIGPNAQIFSTAYLASNLHANTLFMFGLISKYPIIFTANITILAIIGCILLSFKNGMKDKFSILLLLLLLCLGYFMFYAFYFTGSVLSGGSVRFLLVTYPALSILSALGVFHIWDILNAKLAIKPRKYKTQERLSIIPILYAIAILAIFIIPFAMAVPALRHPNYDFEDFPVLFNGTQNIYLASIANRSLSFIDNNYKAVPQDCLVLSEAPYLWYALNRSSALLNIRNLSNLSTEGYSCYVLDYNYWCLESKLGGAALCNYYTSKYKLKVLATESSGQQSNFTIYQLLNYTPN